jgi:PAS domain S-box-containing protein
MPPPNRPPASLPLPHPYFPSALPEPGRALRVVAARLILGPVVRIMSSEQQSQESIVTKPLAAAPAASGAGLEKSWLAPRLVDSLAEGIVVYDRDLRYRHWNPFMEKISGLPASEVLGKHAADVPFPFKERGLDLQVERALAGRAGVLADTPYTQKRTNWSGQLSGLLSPLRDETGAVVGVIGVIQDITRRKRLEEAHLAYEQRYRQLFEDNPQPMWVHDVETLAFLAVNEAALSHYGYTREEFLFMTMDGILAPSDLPAPPREGADLRGGVDEAHLWRHRTKAGRIIDVEINSQVVNFAGRRAVLVVANDVTERLKVQQHLRESELRYRTLIEGADVAIFLSEAATGLILEANRRAETLLGLPRHKIVGLHLRELAPPELAADRTAPRGRPGLPLSSTAAQAYVWHRAGRRIPVDIIAGAIEVGGRKLVQSLYRDITERKRAEEALARRTRQLEVLSRANRRLHAVLQVPAVLRALVESALELAQATGGMAGLLTEGKLVYREYHTRDKTTPVEHSFEPGQGVAGYVLSSKLTYCSNDPERDPLVIPEMQRGYKLRNLVCVPILNHEGVLLGCLELHNTENQRSIEESDLTMLEVLAASAAIAIENARRLQQHAALLESVPDGILVVDAQGRLVSHNQHFVRMWRIPKAILESRDDEQALAFVRQQLKDPQSFLEKVKQVYATPEADSHDHLEFNDGRVFERFSSPWRVAGTVAGRVWSFRDVSAQCQAKAASRAGHAARKKPR